MGYLIRIRELPLSSHTNSPEGRSYTEVFPAHLNKPPAAFPHLCYIFTSTPGDEPNLRHIGVVMKKGRRPSGIPHVRGIKISSIYDLKRPIRLSKLSRTLAGVHRASLERAVAEGAGIFTEAADAAIVAALIHLDPDLEAPLNRIRNMRRPAASSRSAARWQLGIDATRTSLRIGGFDASRLTTWEAPDQESAPTLAGIKPTPSEKDLIAHDFETVPGWMPTARNAVHIRSFTDGNRHMDILNVDSDKPEAVLGVDLIYYHRESSSSILVQYKKLEDGKKIIVDKRLDDQLDRMKKLSAAFPPTPKSHKEWRIGKDFCYLKLCGTKTKSGIIDPFNMELLPGLYLPLSYVLLALEDERVRGPRGGRYLGYETVDRHLTNTLFIELAKEGWIGSAGTAVQDITEMVDRSRNAGHETIVAVDNSVETFNERIHRNRNRGPRTSNPSPTSANTLF